MTWVGSRRNEAYEAVRHGVGRSILLSRGPDHRGHRADVTIDPTLESALTLGVVVLVRTFLSFSLEVELEGVVPWRRTKGARGTDSE